MLEYLNQDTVANDVRMRREVFIGAFILVEGRSDQKFFSKFVHWQRCQIIICRAKRDVLSTLRTLEAACIHGVIGIVDADFDHVEKTPRQSQLVFWTDTHDAETMMLRSNGCEALLAEFCSPDKLSAWEESQGGVLLATLLHESAKIGFLLWFSQREGRGLNFQNLKLPAFFDDDRLTVDTTRLIQHVLARSGHPHAPMADIETGIVALQRPAPDLWLIARGPDMLALLSRALCRAIGNCRQADVGEEVLHSHLRVAYKVESFRQTSLYRAVTAWAAVQHSYEFFL